MQGLSLSSSSRTTTTAPFNARKLARKMSKAVMKSHHFRIPKYDMPIRLRPWFLVFTCVVMTVLAFLGFTNFSRSLPLNDKLLHFVCFCIATAVFYFIFDPEEDARRIWFWRHSGLIFTSIVCFFFGGIVSEFVQSMLPYKEFDFGDVLANILGSALGLYAAYYLERYYRHRREISRLYRPINPDYISSDSDSDIDGEEAGTQLLPTHYSRRHPTTTTTTTTTTGGGGGGGRHAKSNSRSKTGRLADVWDEREELFGIGPDSGSEGDGEGEEDEGGGRQPPRQNGLSPPRILVSSSDS